MGNIVHVDVVPAIFSEDISRYGDHIANFLKRHKIFRVLEDRGSYNVLFYFENDNSMHVIVSVDDSQSGEIQEVARMTIKERDLGEDFKAYMDMIKYGGVRGEKERVELHIKLIARLAEKLDSMGIKHRDETEERTGYDVGWAEKYLIALFAEQRMELDKRLPGRRSREWDLGR